MVFGVETGMEGGRRGQIRIGFVEEQCFKFGVKELWRDSKGWGFGKFVGWVRYSCRSAGGSLFQRGGTAMAIERSENLSDEVTEGRGIVRAETEREEREGWIVNSQRRIQTFS